MPRSITGGKNYIKKRKPSISTNSCFLAYRRHSRHTSIRQQSDQILAFVAESIIAASPTSVYRRREINGMDRYVFVVQFDCKDSSKKVDKVVGVKSYLSIIIVEVCGEMLGKIHSVMSDTC